jgi:ribosomal protein S18 acetylase RimI-like enzyme
MLQSIRAYTPADWDAICDLHDRARIDELRGSVDLAAFLPLAVAAGPEGLFDGQVWVACVGERVVGFVAAAEDEITWLYVDPDVYRQGIGRALLRHALAHCGPVVGVEVLSGNTSAFQLYRSEGFEVVKTRTGKLAGNEQFEATGHFMQLRR